MKKHVFVCWFWRLTVCFLMAIGGFVCGLLWYHHYNTQIVQMHSFIGLGEASLSLEAGDLESAIIQFYDCRVWYPLWYAPDLALVEAWMEMGYHDLARAHLKIAEEKFESERPSIFESYASDGDKIGELKRELGIPEDNQ